MPGRINLASYSRDQIRAAARSSVSYEYESSVIRDAPERLAKLAGYRDLMDMADSYERNARALRDMKDVPAEFYPVYLGDPDNFHKTPHLYSTIEITLQLIFGEGMKNIQGVQLASNYGPFLFYLREQKGITGLTGIDISHAAVQYASENGIPVAMADARKLPFQDSSQDVVISAFFLNPAYLMLLAPINGYRWRGGGSAFLLDVLKEAYRVLKPGGCLISLLEWFVFPRDKMTAWHPFSTAQFFPEDTCRDAWATLDEIAVLQKPQ